MHSVLHGSVLKKVCELRNSSLTVTKDACQQTGKCTEDRLLKTKIKYYCRTLSKQTKN